MCVIPIYITSGSITFTQKQGASFRSNEFTTLSRHDYESKKVSESLVVRFPTLWEPRPPLVPDQRWRGGRDKFEWCCKPLGASFVLFSVPMGTRHSQQEAMQRVPGISSMMKGLELDFQCFLGKQRCRKRMVPGASRTACSLVRMVLFTAPVGKSTKLGWGWETTGLGTGQDLGTFQ